MVIPFIIDLVILNLSVKTGLNERPAADCLQKVMSLETTEPTNHPKMLAIKFLAGWLLRQDSRISLKPDMKQLRRGRTRAITE